MSRRLLTKPEKRWLQMHERLLPKMTDGQRINGDPIIYMGTALPDWIGGIRGSSRSGGRPERKAHHNPGLILFNRAVQRAQLTAIEAYVLSRRCAGARQREIAAELDVRRQYVSQVEATAKIKLKSAVGGPGIAR